MAENPVIEDPKALEGEKKPETPPAEPTEADAFMAQLAQAGISNAKELEGKLDAGVQAGHLAQLYGTEKQKVAELQAQLDKKPVAPPAPLAEDTYGEPDPNQTVDLAKVIGSEVNKALDARDQRTAAAQQQTMQAWGEIQSDEDYGLVKPVWEKKLSDPNFQLKVNSGQTTIQKEYNRTLRDFYKGIAKKSLETIKVLRGEKPATPVPHMESGTEAILLPDELTDNQTKVKGLKDKVNTGGMLSEDEQMDALDAVFGQP